MLRNVPGKPFLYLEFVRGQYNFQGNLSNSSILRIKTKAMDQNLGNLTLFRNVNESLKKKSFI